MPNYYDYYNDMSLDEICMQFRLDTQNLLHEMDLSILCKEYNYLLENGYTIDYGSIHEASDKWTSIKNWFNKWIEWARNLLRIARDKISKAYNVYIKFRFLKNDVRTANWFNIYKADFPYALNNLIPRVLKSPDYKNKLTVWKYVNIYPKYKDIETSKKLWELENKIINTHSLTDIDDAKKEMEEIFKKYPDHEFILYVDGMDIKKFYTDHNYIKNSFDYIYNLYEKIRDSCSDDIQKAYSNDDAESIKYFKEKLKLASEFLTEYIQFLQHQCKYYHDILYVSGQYERNEIGVQ